MTTDTWIVEWWGAPDRRSLKWVPVHVVGHQARTFANALAEIARLRADAAKALRQFPEARQPVLRLRNTHTDAIVTL